MGVNRDSTTSGYASTSASAPGIARSSGQTGLRTSTIPQYGSIESAMIGLNRGLPLFPSDAPSSLTYSPPPSTQGSVWSPVQTDFASDITVTGTSGSRVPSPLRNMATISVGVDESICPENECEVNLDGKEDLGAHSGASHPHICLWGVNGPCDSAGFATKEELNWHVKREHLLLCPDPRCTEGPFETRDLLDCHLKCAHDNVAAGKNVAFQPANLLGATPVLSGTPTPTPAIQGAPSATNTKSPEEKTLKMEMSIGISKKRCRDQLRTVLEKRIKRANGGTPRAGESPGLIRSRTPKLLESATFPIIWEHGVLPFLIEFIPKWCGPGHVISVSRGKKPNARRICIMTKREVSMARRLVIAGHVRDLLPENHRNLVTFVFSIGKVDRLVWARGLGKDMPDEICLPRNPFCYINPCMGDSIGTTAEDGDEITATLGPCVTIDGASYWLVSFHPFVEMTKTTRLVSVEHPSPMDRKKCLEESHDTLSNGDLDFRVGDLTATSGYDLNTTRISHDPYWEDTSKEPPLVVTDWALVSARGRRANLLRKFPSTTQRQETPVISMSSIVPGATVWSTGRTSGLQRGQVCDVPAYVDGSENGTGKATREWYIEEPYPYDDEDAWIRGGIGVEGDSGAAIIDCDTNSLVGQLWGRNTYYGPGPRHTYFTPIFDIFDDIQERCGQERRAQLPQYLAESERWPVYPVCRQCFDLREYLESRRCSRESLVSMIGINDDGRAGDTDNDLTSVSELATPREQSQLVRHIGPDETSSLFSGVVSPAPVHAFYSIPQGMSPYAHTLNDDDLYERCPGGNGGTLGVLPTPMGRDNNQQPAKRRRIT
ncbi:hypothetical protein F5Y04DRAFT_272044 [Hypomontagnella monticulosa]|nr:hypothetical protein F5Y04DRAFT_272044 [Hypomontagnella monticulosa]